MRGKIEIISEEMKRILEVISNDPEMRYVPGKKVPESLKPSPEKKARIYERITSRLEELMEEYHPEEERRKKGKKGQEYNFLKGYIREYARKRKELEKELEKKGERIYGGFKVIAGEKKVSGWKD